MAQVSFFAVIFTLLCFWGSLNCDLVADFFFFNFLVYVSLEWWYKDRVQGLAMAM